MLTCTHSPKVTNTHANAQLLKFTSVCCVCVCKVCEVFGSRLAIFSSGDWTFSSLMGVKRRIDFISIFCAEMLLLQGFVISVIRVQIIDVFFSLRKCTQKMEITCEGKCGAVGCLRWMTLVFRTGIMTRFRNKCNKDGHEHVILKAVQGAEHVFIAFCTFGLLMVCNL